MTGKIGQERTNDCQALLERLSAYLDGDLSAPECRVIERHTRSCTRCTKTVQELRRTVGLCHEAAAKPLPAAVRRRAQLRVRALMRTLQ